MACLECSPWIPWAKARECCKAARTGVAVGDFGSQRVRRKGVEVMTAKPEHIVTHTHRVMVMDIPDACAQEGLAIMRNVSDAFDAPELSEPPAPRKSGILTAVVAIAATVCAVLLAIHAGVPRP